MSGPLGLLVLAAIVALLLFAWCKPAGRAYPWVMLGVAGLGLLLTLLPPEAVDIPWFSLRWTEIRYQRGAALNGGLGLSFHYAAAFTAVSTLSLFLKRPSPRQVSYMAQSLLALVLALFTTNLLILLMAWAIIGWLIEHQAESPAHPVSTVLSRLSGVLIGIAILLVFWEGARLSDFRIFELDYIALSETLQSHPDVNGELLGGAGQLIRLALVLLLAGWVLGVSHAPTGALGWAVLALAPLTLLDLFGWWPWIISSHVKDAMLGVAIVSCWLVASVAMTRKAGMAWILAGLFLLIVTLIGSYAPGTIAMIFSAALAWAWMDSRLQQAGIESGQLRKLGGLQVLRGVRIVSFMSSVFMAAIPIFFTVSFLSYISDGYRLALALFTPPAVVLLSFAVIRIHAMTFEGPRRIRSGFDYEQASKKSKKIHWQNGFLMYGYVALATLCVAWVLLFEKRILMTLALLLPALLAGGFAYVLYGPAWRITQKMLFTSPIDLYLKLDVFGPNLANMQFGNPKIDPWLPRVAAFANSRTYRWSRAVYVRVHRVLVTLSEPEKWRWEALGRPVEGLAIAVRLTDAGVGGLGLLLRALANAAAASAALVDKHILGRLSGRP